MPNSAALPAQKHVALNAPIAGKQFNKKRDYTKQIKNQNHALNVGKFSNRLIPGIFSVKENVLKKIGENLFGNSSVNVAKKHLTHSMGIKNFVQRCANRKLKFSGQENKIGKDGMCRLGQSLNVLSVILILSRSILDISTAVPTAMLMHKKSYLEKLNIPNPKNQEFADFAKRIFSPVMSNQLLDSAVKDAAMRTELLIMQKRLNSKKNYENGRKHYTQNGMTAVLN